MGLNRALIAGAIAALPLALAASPAQADDSVQVMLEELNGSGASGTGTLTVTDNGDLRVYLETPV